MLIGTHEYERGRTPSVKKHDSVDEEDIDPCGEARKMMNVLAMTTIQEARERIAQEEVPREEKECGKWGLLQVLTETLVKDTIGQWSNMMRKHQIDYLNLFMKMYPDFLKTMTTDRLVNTLQSSQNAVKKTKKKEKDFHAKVAVILETELGRREREG